MTNNRIISRRGSLGRMGLVGAAGVLGAARPELVSANPQTPATAFALIGDKYHNSDYIRIGLNKTLVRDAGLSIDFTDEVKLLNADTLKNYRMLILFRDGMQWPGGYMYHWYPGYNLPEKAPAIESDPPLDEMDSSAYYWLQDHQGKAVREFVENGGSVLVYHNSYYISRGGDENYREALGAITNDHPPIRAYWVRIKDHDHPVTRGVNDFMVVDEQHYLIYDKDPKYVLATSEQREGIDFKGVGSVAEACFAYDYGKGRVCYMSPGHMISVLWNKEYEKMQKNAVRWLLRET
jgi:hypothetical protein